MSAPLIEFAVWEDSGASLMARITGNDATNIQQADVTTIAYTVSSLATDADTGVVTGTETATGTLTVSSVVFDTLQTDARWTLDSTGYNFRWDVPASIFATGDTVRGDTLQFLEGLGRLFLHKPFTLEELRSVLGHDIKAAS